MISSLIRNKAVTILLLLCFWAVHLSAQRFSREFRIHYIVDSISIDPAFENNEWRIEEIRQFLRSIRNDKQFRIDSVKFTGTASPEGYYEANNWLSENRLENFKKLIREEIDIPDSIIFLNDSYITWKMFRNAVEASDIPRRNAVLEIIDMEPKLVYWQKNMHTDFRMLKLRNMDKGNVYETLKPILFHERFATAEFVLTRQWDISEPYMPDINMRDCMNFVELDIPELYPNKGVRRLYLKTNFVMWAMLLSNLSVEVDLAAHWTLGLEIFYSKWDYFKPTIKFRMAGFRPELRYYFNPKENDGWFIGGHFGYSYYNMAFNGKYRYQDLYGETPTTGGGITGGWRKQFGHNHKWRLEFALGAGIYPLHYSLFYNTPDYKDGQWVEERKKIFCRVDQAAVTLGYAIDLYKYKKRVKMKGGEK